MLFGAFVLKNLIQRPTRSGLTVAGIAVGIATIVALASVARGFERAWVRIYSARGTDLVVIKAASFDPPAFQQEQAAPIQAIPGVAKTSSVLQTIMGIESAPMVLVFGWEANTFVWEHLRLVSGRWPSGDREPAVVLGSMVADALGKRIGSEVQLDTFTFTVSGIFDSDSFTENGAVVMTLPQLQRITDRPRKLSSVNVKLAPGATPDDIAVARQAIAARMPDFKVFSAGEIASQTAVLQAIRALSWIIGAIALGVGALGVANTLLMSLFERIREIGVLLAVGWRRSRIIVMVLLESVSLGLVGGIVGTAFGAVAVKLLERTRWVEGKIEGDFSPGLFGVALIISLAVGFLGGLYPAIRTSRLNPADALRHE